MKYITSNNLDVIAKWRQQNQEVWQNGSHLELSRCRHDPNPNFHQSSKNLNLLPRSAPGSLKWEHRVQMWECNGDSCEEEARSLAVRALGWCTHLLFEGLHSSEVPSPARPSLSTETPASGRGAGSATLVDRTVHMECGRARTVSFRCERWRKSVDELRPWWWFFWDFGCCFNMHWYSKYMFNYLVYHWNWCVMLTNLVWSLWLVTLFNIKKHVTLSLVITQWLLDK